MTKLNVGLVVLAFGVAVGAPTPARAQDQCKPVVGSFEAHLVFDGCTSPVGLCTAGRVWGGLQGTYQFVMSDLTASGRPTAAQPLATIMFFGGDSKVTLKSGDLLPGEDTGAIDLARGGFASLITFHGGTGAAANASGQIRLRGEYDPVAGTTSGDYIGSICMP